MRGIARLAVTLLGVWMVLLPFLRPMTFLMALVVIILGVNVIVWSISKA